MKRQLLLPLLLIAFGCTGLGLFLYFSGSHNSTNGCTEQGEPVITKIQDGNGGPEMKVIIDSEGNVGRYIGENETSYQGETQDFYWIEKDKARTEIMKACEGEGILTLKDTGTKPVFTRPDTQSDVAGTMIHEEGYVPEVYRCLGYTRGWFLADVDGKSGFIQEDLVNWDAINTF